MSAKPEVVNVAADTNIYKGNDEIEQQPGFYHLYIGCDWQAIHYCNVHAGQHQHHSQVQGYCRLKVEWFEVVCDVSNNVENNGRNVHCGKDAEKTAAKKNKS